MNIEEEINKLIYENIEQVSLEERQVKKEELIRFIDYIYEDVGNTQEIIPQKLVLDNEIPIADEWSVDWDVVDPQRNPDYVISADPYRPGTDGTAGSVTLSQNYITYRARHDSSIHLGPIQPEIIVSARDEELANVLEEMRRML